MRRTKTARLLNELNALRGKAMRDIGYVYFADIRGDGTNRRSVYEVINAGGGVSYASELNGGSPAARCRNIERAIARAALANVREREAATIDANRHYLGRAPTA